MKNLSENRKSTTDIYAILKNKRKYKNIRLKCLNLMYKRYGYDLFVDCNLPSNFNYDSLTMDYFTRTYTQSVPIPLSDKMFKKLTRLPKKVINTPFRFYNGGKRICGQYMLSTFNGKPMLYAFSVIQDEKSPNENFNLKLDVCINGKDWIQLARLDSAGAPHPNYYDENSFAKEQSDVQFIPAPHVHYCIERSQVLNGTKFDYMPAKHVDLESMKVQNGKSTLENGLEYFLQFTNIQDTLNLANLKSDNFADYVFDNNGEDSRFVYTNDDALAFLNTHLCCSLER